MNFQHTLLSIYYLLSITGCIDSFSTQSSTYQSPPLSSLPENQKRTRTTTTPIITCSSNIELKRAISFYIQPNDNVLELGSQLNDISNLICQKIKFEKKDSDDQDDHSHEKKDGSALFVDIKRRDASSGRCQPRDFDTFLQKMSNIQNNNNNFHQKTQIQFQELEQFDQWRNIILQPSSSSKRTITNYDVMILDVGTMIGNDLHLTALSIANEFIAHQQQNHHHQPRVIIIKSKVLSNLARRIIHSQRLFDGSSGKLFVKQTEREKDVNDTILPNESHNTRHVTSSSSSRRSNTPYIIACVGVNEYRRTIPFIVEKGDEIMEVGCHFGQSTVLLHEAATTTKITKTTTTTAIEEKTITSTLTSPKKGFCIGVDIGPKIIQHAKDKYPHVPFCVGNAWNVLQLLKFGLIHHATNQNDHDEEDKHKSTSTPSSRLGYDLVYADIGGLSGSDGLIESLSLLDSIGQGMEPRCIVIKSLCMNRLASQLKAFSDVWSKIERKE